MRADATHRLLLNAPLFKAFSIEVHSEKYVRFSVIEGSTPTSYMLRVRPSPSLSLSPFSSSSSCAAPADTDPSLNISHTDGQPCGGIDPRPGRAGQGRDALTSSPSLLDSPRPRPITSSPKILRLLLSSLRSLPRWWRVSLCNSSFVPLRLCLSLAQDERLEREGVRERREVMHS